MTDIIDTIDPIETTEMTTNPSGQNTTTDIGDAIVHAVENLARAATPADVWAVVKSLALGFGYDRLVVLEDCRDPTLSALPVVLHDDLRPDQDQTLRAGLWKDAVPLLRAYAAAKPFHAEDAPQTEESRRLARLLGDLSAQHALIVPVSRLLEFAGVMLFKGPAPEASPIVRSALHVLAHCAFDRLRTQRYEPKRREQNILSRREAECLRWAAAGKTDNEIGAILSISPRTARFHIENAKKKLGVSTRIQAVTEALRLKAIAA